MLHRREQIIHSKFHMHDGETMGPAYNFVRDVPATAASYGAIQHLLLCIPHSSTGAKGKGLHCQYSEKEPI